MKIVYTCDLHGDKKKYKLVSQAALEHRAEVVINGGDMLPKTDDGSIFNIQDRFFEYLEKHFAVFENENIHYLCFLGNDDLANYDEKLDRLCSGYKYVKNIAQRRTEINGLDFIGMNLVVDYPFRLKDRCRKDTGSYQIGIQYGTGFVSSNKGFKEIPDWESYVKSMPSLEDELDRLPLPRHMDKAFYVIHMPPAGLGLDVCSDGRKVGSRAVYNFILRNQPKMSLHGHIHESPQISGVWKANIGRTICVQPGQSGRLTYVLMDLLKNSITLICK